MGRLILSTFPGIDVLGLGFEQELEGVCVVRGPDLLFGSLHDVRRFHIPRGAFWGIVGGPPCQIWSRMRYVNPLAGQKHGNQIPEFERLCVEGEPEWFLMENVQEAPEPTVPGYIVRSIVVNNRWVPGHDPLIGAEQNRERRFSFGTRDGRTLSIEVAPFEAPLRQYAVTSSARPVPVALIRDGNGGHRRKSALRAPTGLSGHGAAPGQRDALRLRVPSADGAGHTNFPDEPEYSLEDMCRLQGLPEAFADELPFTKHGKRKVIGNAVPLYLARAIARAVKAALAAESRVA